MLWGRLGALYSLGKIHNSIGGKTFNEMLELGRSIADAWNMKLCDESFNTISEQRISEYKNEAHEVDLKNGSYGG